MEDVDSLSQIIENMVRGGVTPLEAYRRLSPFIPQEALKEAMRKFEEKTGRIRTLKWPSALKGSDVLQNWYTGPSPEDRFWPRLREYLLKTKGWSPEVVQSLDDSSTKIVSMLQPTGFPKISTKGLVVGYVQSGKTANFTAVISKAADIGYKFFIVLSGMTKILRHQTQVRLDQELANTADWYLPTSAAEDFRPGGPVRNVNAMLTEKRDLKVLCVVKKNAAVLRRLLNWLRAATPEVLSSCPVLIIDDEADQASINASKYENDRTKINQLLIEILQLLPKAAYIGYTATPFANVFIDPSVPEDLYPRDFIVDLPKPDNYFGAERIFGRDLLPQDDPDASYEPLDVIRPVPEDEVDFLRPHGRADRHTFQPELTPSLENALRYFWMAAAARIVRGQADEHSTMLIHTTLHTDVHDRFKPLVESYKQHLRRGLNEPDAQLLQSLRGQWEEEQTRVPPAEMNQVAVSFDALLPHLSQVVDSTRVVIENSMSQQRLDFEEEGQIRIVIGGNTLSRGLTLEGLIVSFFIRTSSAYDTLLQMGRWFGYREDYVDLPRMWMTEELARYFYYLATVEQEIRDDINLYDDQGMTPLEFGVRVRTHPDLSITSELKMQHAVPAEVSYNGMRRQTPTFRHKDSVWLGQNLEAARKLVKRITARGVERGSVRSSSIVFHDIPAEDILAFIDEYNFHKSPGSLLRRDLIKGYIEDQNAGGELLRWNVVIKGKDKGESEEGTIDLGSGVSVPLLTRSRRSRIGMTASDTAHLGAIMSRGDTVIDLNYSSAELKHKEVDLIEHRIDHSRNGLLVIYPISKDSKPSSSQGANQPPSKFRAPLEAVEHLIGVGLVFPRTEQDTPQHYMTVDLSGVEIEELDWVPADEESDTE
jgi:hypothetical protein